jgi:hypothetical protein
MENVVFCSTIAHCGHLPENTSLSNYDHYTRAWSLRHLLAAEFLDKVHLRFGRRSQSIFCVFSA